jgi:hypothetical protein
LPSKYAAQEKNLEKILISNEKMFEDFKHLKTSKDNPWKLPHIVWNPVNKRWESRFGHQWFEIAPHLLKNEEIGKEVKEPLPYGMQEN